MTVKELLAACQEAIAEGYGDRLVVYGYKNRPVSHANIITLSDQLDLSDGRYFNVYNLMRDWKHK